MYNLSGFVEKVKLITGDEKVSISTNEGEILKIQFSTEAGASYRLVSYN